MINRFTLEPALLAAVEASQYDVVEAYLRSGAKGTAQSADGSSPLHIAARAKDLKMIGLLLALDADASIRNAKNETPIASAATEKHWDSVIAIANARKENANRYQYGSALLTASESNQLLAVEALLKAGASLNWFHPSNNNRSLHYAASHNNAPMVSVLLQHGANPALKNTAGQTPIVLAAKKNCWDAVIAFAHTQNDERDHAEYGYALFLAASANQLNAVEALLQARARTTWHDTNTMNTTLHQAASNQNSGMIRLLLQFGANPGIKNTAGETPVMLAANKRFWEAVITFAVHKRDVKDQFQYGDVLRVAAFNNQYKAVKALLEAGAVTTWSHSSDGNTPLHDAVRHQNAPMVALLRIFRANPNRENTSHETPVLLAARLKFWDCSKALVEPQKYMIKEIVDFQLILFYLFTAHANRDNKLFGAAMPYDIFKLIMNYAFCTQSPDLYNYDVAHKKYVELRPDRQYLISASRFIREYRFFRYARPQSADSVQFVNSLEMLAGSRESVDKRAAKIRDQIGAFVTRKGDTLSRAVTLLATHNLFKPAVCVTVASDTSSTSSITRDQKKQ